MHRPVGPSLTPRPEKARERERAGMTPATRGGAAALPRHAVACADGGSRDRGARQLLLATDGAAGARPLGYANRASSTASAASAWHSTRTWRWRPPPSRTTGLRPNGWIGSRGCAPPSWPHCRMWTPQSPRSSAAPPIAASSACWCPRCGGGLWPPPAPAGLGRLRAARLAAVHPRRQHLPVAEHGAGRRAIALTGRAARPPRHRFAATPGSATGGSGARGGMRLRRDARPALCPRRAYAGWGAG